MWNFHLSKNHSISFCEFNGNLTYIYLIKINLGEIEMGETGKKDKRKREQKKKPKLTIKEKRKLKREKKSTSTGIS